MDKLYFDLARVVAIAEATVAAPAHVNSVTDQMEGRSTGPALEWVHDAGVYLMSNADPRPVDDVLYAHAHAPDGPLLVGAQEGEPSGLSDEIVGGDDFAEPLRLVDGDRLLERLRAGLAAGHRWFVLGVDVERFTMSTEQ